MILNRKKGPAGRRAVIAKCLCLLTAAAILGTQPAAAASGSRLGAYDGVRYSYPSAWAPLYVKDPVASPPAKIRVSGLYPDGAVTRFVANWAPDVSPVAYICAEQLQNMHSSYYAQTGASRPGGSLWMFNTPYYISRIDGLWASPANTHVKVYFANKEPDRSQVTAAAERSGRVTVNLKVYNSTAEYYRRQLVSAEATAVFGGQSVPLGRSSSGVWQLPSSATGQAVKLSVTVTYRDQEKLYSVDSSVDGERSLFIVTDRTGWTEAVPWNTHKHTFEFHLGIFNPSGGAVSGSPVKAGVYLDQACTQPATVLKSGYGVFGAAAVDANAYQKVFVGYQRRMLAAKCEATFVGNALGTWASRMKPVSLSAPMEYGADGVFHFIKNPESHFNYPKIYIPSAYPDGSDYVIRMKVTVSYEDLALIYGNDGSYKIASTGAVGTHTFEYDIPVLVNGSMYEDDFSGDRM